MTLKERLNELPQIDAQFEFDNTAEYADGLMGQLLRHYTLNEIAAHSGISRRNLSYLRNNGITNFPQQVTLEILAGYRVLDLEEDTSG